MDASYLPAAGGVVAWSFLICVAIWYALILPILNKEERIRQTMLCFLVWFLFNWLLFFGFLLMPYNPIQPPGVFGDIPNPRVAAFGILPLFLFLTFVFLALIVYTLGRKGSFTNSTNSYSIYMGQLYSISETENH